jgi:hypothetical protein
VARSVLAENQGKPFDAFGAYWQRWEGFFGEAVQGCNALAAALEQYATAIEDARHKIEIIAAAAAAVIAAGIVLTIFTLGASDAAAAAAAGGMALEAAAVETTLMSVVTSIAVDAGIGALEGAVLDAALQVVRIEVFHDQRSFNWAELGESAGIGLVGGVVGGGLAAGGGRIASRLLPDLAASSPRLARGLEIAGGMPEFAKSGLGGMAVGGGTAAITDEITTGHVNPWDVVEGTVIGGVAGGTAGRLAGKAAGAKIEPLSTPVVQDAKLANIVTDLYKGTTNPTRVGTGTTADAVRNEIRTGEPTNGRWHFQKALDSSRALQNWLKRNPSASFHDRLVAQSLLDDLLNALAGK